MGEKQGGPAGPNDGGVQDNLVHPSEAASAEHNRTARRDLILRNQAEYDPTKRDPVDAYMRNVVETNPHVFAVEEAIEQRRWLLAGGADRPEIIDQVLDLEDTVTQQLWENRHVGDPTVNAEALLRWLKETNPETNRDGSPAETELVGSILPKFLGQDPYDKVGAFLENRLKHWPTESYTLHRWFLEDPDQTHYDIPRRVFDAIIQNYVRTGYIRLTSTDKLSLTAQFKKSSQELNFLAIENADLAYRALRPRTAETNADDKVLEQMYDEHSEATRVLEHVIKTAEDPKNARVLFLSELLIGNQFSDVKFFAKVIEQVKALPEHMRPQAIVVSGLVQGDYKFFEKRQRGVLVPELNSMDLQFRHAKQVLDSLAALGVPVIYTTSDDDRRIARDYTAERFRLMSGLAKSQELNWHELDKMERHPEWNRHLSFQTDVVFPYCLRSGRRLRSAAEMRAATGGALAAEEYSLLYEVYGQLQRGEEVNQRYAQWLDMDNLPFFDTERENDFLIAHDLDLTLNDRSIWIRHRMHLSTQPAYQDTLSVPAAAMQQLLATGKEAPHMLATLHGQQGAGLLSGLAIVSTLGFTNSEAVLHTRAQNSELTSQARRQVATRRRISGPGATMHELGPNGMHTVTVFTKGLMERAASLPDRTALVFFNDWQNGSATSRPDLQVKFMRYALEQIMPNQPTYLFLNGDIIQGHNYPSFPIESGETVGLISTTSQQAFVRQMIQNAILDTNRNDLRNLLRVGITVGNHEWNTPIKRSIGEDFTQFLKDNFELLYRLNRQDHTRVKRYRAIDTPYGENLKTPTGFEEIGDYGVLVQHMPMERGGKGAGGPAIFQAHALFMGLGELASRVNIASFGHWHNPQFDVSDEGKAAAISGSLAGLSGYEWWRGYRAEVGALVVEVGDGLPVQLRFVSKGDLDAYKIKRGHYSNRNLAKEGFRDDPSHDPARHGMFPQGNWPHSALQQALLKEIQDIKAVRGETSEIKVVRHFPGVK